MLPPAEVYFVSIDRQGGRPRRPPYHRLYLKYPQAKMYFDYYKDLPAEMHRLLICTTELVDGRIRY